MISQGQPAAGYLGGQGYYPNPMNNQQLLMYGYPQQMMSKEQMAGNEMSAQMGSMMQAGFPGALINPAMYSQLSLGTEQ